MNEQENIALVKKLYEAFARGDIQVILDHVTEDIEWSNPGPSSIPYSGDRTGPAQVRQFFEALATTQEAVNLSMDRFIAQGDTVAALGNYSGKVTATGKSFASRVGHFFTIRGGKVASWIGLGDTAALAEAYTGASAASG
jgi:hypothetical protein